MLGQLERELTTRHADVVQSFCEQNGLDRFHIDVIGFHGLHRCRGGTGRQAPVAGAQMLGVVRWRAA